MIPPTTYAMSTSSPRVSGHNTPIDTENSEHGQPTARPVAAGLNTATHEADDTHTLDSFTTELSRSPPLSRSHPRKRSSYEFSDDLEADEHQTQDAKRLRVNISTNHNASNSPNLENIIQPATDFPTPKPTPKADGESAKTGLIRESQHLTNSSHPPNKDLVALRLRHNDLSSRDYRWADYGSVEQWVEREQAFKLNELLQQARPNRPRATKTGLVRDMPKTKISGLTKSIVKWCNKEPQRRLDFWDSADIIDQLQNFNLSRNLSIFDLVQLAKQAELCIAEGQPLKLHVSPSLGLEAKPKARSGQTSQVPQEPFDAHHPHAWHVAASRQPPTNSGLLVPSNKQDILQPPQLGKSRPQVHSTLRQQTKQPPPYGTQQGLKAFETTTGTATPKLQSTKRLDVWRDEMGHMGQDEGPPTVLQNRTNLPPGELPSKRASNVGGERLPQAPLNGIPAESISRKRKAEEVIKGNEVRKQKVLHNQSLSIPTAGDEKWNKFRSSVGEDCQNSAPSTAELNTQSRIADNVVPYPPRGALFPGIAEDRCWPIRPGAFEPQLFDPQDPRPYAAYMGKVIYSGDPLRPQDTQYVPLPSERVSDALNMRLNEAIPPVGQIPPLFRDFTLPNVDDMSLLARCVRFAHAHAQRDIDWRIHPVHVHEIVERTNPYGLELLRCRTSMTVGRYPTRQQDFECSIAIRAARVLFTMDHSKFHVAADIPDLVAHSHNNLEHTLAYVLGRIDELNFGPFVAHFYKECCKLWGQDWPYEELSPTQQLATRTTPQSVQRAPSQGEREASPPIDPRIL